MFFGGEPNCAKLFSRIKELNEGYGNNIENICARDLLSDTMGLTVVFPDAAFIKEFDSLVNTKTPDMDSLSNARRMLQNTIIKRNLTNSEDFKQFNHSLPLRSGLTLNATDTQGDDIVILDNNVKLQKDKKFKTVEPYNYSLWIVESGKYPTTIHFRPKKTNFKKPTGGSHYNPQSAFIDDTEVVPFDQQYAIDQTAGIATSASRALTFGGGKDQYIIQVGRLLRNSPDTLRVSFIAAILSEYKIELMRDRCNKRNPLIIKAASLYNWLSMYYPQILEIILPITDVHPGITLMLLILDPLSPITVDMLLGTGNNADTIQTADGWRGTELSNDPYTDWSNYLKKASDSIKHGESVLKTINKHRDNISQNTSLDYAAAVALVKSMYINVSKTGALDGVQIIPRNTINAMYSGDKHQDRKMWQDQLRFVATCAFSGSCDSNIISGMDIDEELSQAVKFRPMQGYTSACTFTVLQGNYSSKDDYYAFLKWLYSTDLLYTPQSLDSKVCTSTAAPYDGVEYGKVSRSQILNNYYIKNQMVSGMKSTSTKSASLIYAMAWANRSGLGASTKQSMPFKEPEAPAPAPVSVPIGGEFLHDPINLGKIRSMDGLSSNQSPSNYGTGKMSDDFSYGDHQIGQENAPGMYGQTYDFPKGRDIPYQSWGIGGNVRPSPHLNTPYNNNMPYGNFDNLVDST